MLRSLLCLIQSKVSVQWFLHCQRRIVRLRFLRNNTFRPHTLCFLLALSISTVLLNENARLRSLVGTLSSFIGSGLGGLVARVGLTEEGVQATANEGYYDLLKREAIHLDATAQSKQAEGTVSQSAGSSSSSSACSSNHSDNCASFPSRSTSRSSHMPQTASAQITVTHSARPLALVGPAVRPSKIASVEKSTSSPPRTVDPSLYTTRFSSSEIDPAQCNHGTNLYSTLSYPPDMLPTISPTDSCTISRASHHFATSSGHQTLPLELDLDLPLFNTNFIDQG